MPTTKDNWQKVKEIIISHLKGAAVKAALKKVLGSSSAGGFRGWLVKFITVELFDELAAPVIKFSIRKGFLIYDKIDGSFKLKKINKAKDENNTNDYWDNIGSI
jgi:hypothetical protein